MWFVDCSYMIKGLQKSPEHTLVTLYYGPDFLNLPLTPKIFLGPAWLWFPHVGTMCLHASKECLHTVPVNLATKHFPHSPAQSFTGPQYSSTDEYNRVGSMSNSLSIIRGR